MGNQPVAAGSVFIAELGSDRYAHRFGGDSWRVQAPAGASPLPRLLLVLDLADPKLEFESANAELPLCSRVDGMSLDPQSYLVDFGKRQASFEGAAWNEPLDPRDSLPDPLVEKPLRLRPALPAEDSSQTDVYQVHDTFLGGPSFLRIGGDPLWLTGPEAVRCACGATSRFVAGVGYEKYDDPSGIVDAVTPFFLGELALFFFLCTTCNRITVISQSS